MINLTMPRYFFHVLRDGSSTVDEEGEELADREAARVQACRALGAIVADEMVRMKDAVQLAIMVDDQDGKRVAGIKVVTNIMVS